MSKPRLPAARWTVGHLSLVGALVALWVHLRPKPALKTEPPTEFFAEDGETPPRTIQPIPPTPVTPPTLGRGEWAKASSFEVNLKFAANQPTVQREFWVSRPHVSASHSEEIYPAWVPPLDAAATVTEANKHWSDSVEQSRTASKWIATALGAALAALLGTAPLAALNNRSLSPTAFLVAAGGLLTAALLLFLILRVLSPSITGIDDLLPLDRGVIARFRVRDLQQLREKLEQASGAQLPLGVTSVSELVGRMLLEAVTLDALADLMATANPRDAALLGKVKTTRAAWYALLQQVTQEVMAAAAAQKVQTRARAARRWGPLLGVVAIASITVAFLDPFTPLAAGPAAYELVRYPDQSKATTSAQAALGAGCVRFTATVTGHKPPANATATERSDQWVNLTVTAGEKCAKASITVPSKDLVIATD